MQRRLWCRRTVHERNLYGPPFCRIAVDGKWFFWNMHGREHQPGNGLFLSVYVDDIKMAAKKHDLESMWKKLMKHNDREKPTSCFDLVHLECTQRARKPSKHYVVKHRKRFESRISAGQLKSNRILRKVVQNAIAWPYDMEGHAKRCVERYCEVANNNIEQWSQVSTHCIK